MTERRLVSWFFVVLFGAGACGQDGTRPGACGDAVCPALCDCAGGPDPACPGGDQGGPEADALGDADGQPELDQAVDPDDGAGPGEFGGDVPEPVCLSDADCAGAFPGLTVCLAPYCDGATGRCATAAAHEGEACDDGDACTSAEACTAGVCVGTPRACDDGNACTGNGCDPASGLCRYTALSGGACDDGNPCTTDDACGEGVCTGAATPECDCRLAGACVNERCFGQPGCESEAGYCGDGHDNDGDGRIDCADDDCAGSGGPGGHSCEPAGETTCHDGFDNDGDGVGDCADPDCAGRSCDDGLFCTRDEICEGEACVGLPRDALCDDEEVCTVDTCDAGQGCAHEALPDGSGCGSALCAGLVWTAAECVAGLCVAAVLEDCADDSACTRDQCDAELGCTRELLPDGSECGPRRCDGLRWLASSCQTGFCTGATLVEQCASADACQAPVCDAEAGCSTQAAADGTPCGDRYCDGLVWTEPACVAGVCEGDRIVENCDDGNVCTDDSCGGSSGCRHQNNAEDCSSGYCMERVFQPPRVCYDGACPAEDPAQAVNCVDGEACTADYCDPLLGCFHENLDALCAPARCSGGRFYETRYCQDGTCPSGGSDLCEDSNSCTNNLCAVDIGCYFTEFCCSGGIDDDGDGLTDCADPDCACGT